MKKYYKNIFKNKHLDFGKQYIRYLLSYTTILMIPLIILTFFYSSRFMKKFYHEIYETVDSELMQFGTQLESEWTAMKKIVGQLALDGTAHQAVKAANPLELEPVINQLSGFCAASNFIDDIVLVINENEFVVTCSSTVRKDYYFRRIFPITDEDRKKLEDLLTAPVPGCLPVKDISGSDSSFYTEDMVLFSFPMFTDYQKREGTVLFLVPDSAVQRHLSHKLESYQAQTYIYDPEGTIIAAYGPSPDAAASSDEYVIRSYTSGENNWTYSVYLPDRQDTFAQVSSIMREFIAAIIVTLFLSSFAIYILQKVNYAPVRRLMHSVRQVSPEVSTTDELAAISDALDYLSTRNTTLSTRLSGSLSAIKNERMFRLLNGKYATRQDFNLDCSELDLYLPNGFFAIGIVMFHQDIGDRDLLAQEIKKQFAVPYLYYYLHTFNPRQIVFLVNVPEKASPLGRYFGDTRKYLEEKYNLSATIGIGTATNDTEQIAQSYMEASSALDYRFIKGNGTVIQFREIIGSSRAGVIYPHEEFGILRNALVSHNEQNIRNAVQSIIDFTEKTPVPLYLARSICFDLIHLVNRYYQSGNPAADNSPMELSGMETAQEIIQILHSWSDGLVSSSVSSSGKAAIEDVLSYLDENCLNCDFSAYEAAEHFNMTLPAFSKFFKDATGQNILDYTIHFRIEKAKELLASTKLPLKEISEKVGYYNVSSFTRRFKLNQGVTPGEYRKSCGTKKHHESLT